MSLEGSVVRGVAWSTVELWGREAVTFLVFIVLSRLLGPEAFGLLALATLFILIGNHVTDFGLRSAVVQRPEIDQTALSTAFWSNLALGAALCGVTLVAAGPIATLLSEPLLRPVLQVLSVRFLVAGLSTVHEAVLLRRLAFRPLAVRTNVATLVGGAAGLTLAFSGFGVWSLVAQNVANFLVGAILLWTASGWRPSLRFARPEARRLFAFGLPILGYNLMGQINGRLNQFLIGYYLGAVALGYYVIAFRILSVLLQLLTAVGSRVALPAFARLQHDHEGVRNSLYAVARFTALVAFPAFVGLSVVAPELVVALVGEAWRDSGTLAAVLAAVGLLQTLSYFNAAVFVALGRPQVRLLQLVVHATLNVALFYLAAPWGLVAVTAAFVARAYLLLPFDLWLLHRLVRLDRGRYLRQLGPPLLGSVAMAATVVAFRGSLDRIADPTAGVALAASITVGVVAYAAASALVMPDYVRDLLAMVRRARNQPRASEASR